MLSSLFHCATLEKHTKDIMLNLAKYANIGARGALDEFV